MTFFKHFAGLLTVNSINAELVLLDKISTINFDRKEAGARAYDMIYKEYFKS